MDPNNNNWARNTDSFGQKMLRAQGWEPGQYLGAKDAPHAQWHTAASASHIRVVLKEDNLGIGAGRNNGDQCTGLNDFQDILGRLNGKTDAVVETERKVREDVMVNLYVQRKFGTMRFVRGGWLVGDQVQENPDAEDGAPTNEDSKATSTSSESPEVEEQTGKKAKKSKKRKLEEDASTPEDSEQSSSKKRKAGAGPGEETEKEKRRRERRERKLKKREGDATAAGDVSGAGEEEAEEADKSKAPTTKTKSKKEKKQKGRISKSDDTSEAEVKPSKKKRRKAEEEGATPSETEAVVEATSSLPNDTSTPSTPAESGSSTPIRHLSRKRFIAQKRMAFADPKALQQVRRFDYLLLAADDEG